MLSSTSFLSHSSDHNHRQMGCEVAKVDVAFVQALEHRPKSAVIVAGEEIPLIDLSLLNSPNSGDSDALSDVVVQVEAACRDWGFFQVINHGLPSELLARLESASREFFALPPEEKRKVRRDEANPFGYYETEHTKNVRDWKEVFDFAVEDTTVIPASHESDSEELEILKNQWPEYPPELKEASNEYGRGVEELAYKLVELISLSLGLPAERLNGYFKNGMSFIRLNHYPPCPYPELALGVGRHKDAGGLTVLSQDDVGGLEVKRRSDGEWIRVRPVPGAYIINVGDIIQVWSNDKYRSAEHRVVVNSRRERFSIPFFFNPSHEVMVKPVEELLSDENPPNYKEYNWGKFFKTRKISNYKKLDVENIQISHFKTA